MQAAHYVGALQSQFCVRILLALAAAFASALCSAADVRCDPTTDGFKAPYIVGCSGKSECLASDQFEIRGANENTPALSSACLLLGRDDKIASHLLEVYKYGVPSEAKQVMAPTAWPLAPLIERWITDEKIGPILRSAHRARLPMKVLLIDTDNKRFSVELMLDLSAQWSNGVLPLQIAKVECSPCTFDGFIKLTVPELDTWKLTTKNDPSKLALVIEDTKLPGVVPMVSTADGGALAFRLQRDASKPENTAAWGFLVRRALAGQTEFSIGLADEKGMLVDAPNGGKFDIYSKGKRTLAIIIAAVISLVLLAYFGSATDWKWVRDSYGIPKEVLEREHMSFSLGRCQMLFWTWIILLSWFTIGWATDDWLSINESALMLMGISIGTAVGAIAATPPRVTQLVEAYTSAAAAAARTPSDAALESAKKSALEAIANNAQIRTKTFWSDLTSNYDEDAGLHRVQSVIFTLSFGFYYIYQAFHQGAMPVLSATMLAMVGISGSAYVGFKMAGK